MFLKEKQKINKGFLKIIGCDEVGRGSLAGPVVAAAVAFDLADKDFLKTHQSWLAQIRDSKELSPVKRSTLAALIREHSLAWGIGLIEPEIIDEINIHQATLRAMALAVQAAKDKVSSETDKDYFIFVDGKFIIPELDIEQAAVVNGDSLITSISAASIVAKVYRDELMVKLHEKFPSYNLAQHKGYGTAAHIQALKAWGLSPIHRVSFCGNIV